ncbi:hypothetical protein AAVH_19515 [Aphelenchoides avenae]|nr:hypothetical protein AAVH_19515 [Aphelenchus avenae]
MLRDYDYFYGDKQVYVDYGRAGNNNVDAVDKHNEDVDDDNGYYSEYGGDYFLDKHLDKYGRSNVYGDFDGGDGDNNGGTCGYVTYHGDFCHIERNNYECI